MVIFKVSAYVYLEGSDLEPDYVLLTNLSQDNIYTGNFTGTEKGNYYIDFEVLGMVWK